MFIIINSEYETIHGIITSLYWHNTYECLSGHGNDWYLCVDTQTYINTRIKICIPRYYKSHHCWWEMLLPEVEYPWWQCSEWKLWLFSFPASAPMLEQGIALCRTGKLVLNTQTFRSFTFSQNFRRRWLVKFDKFIQEIKPRKERDSYLREFECFSRVKGYTGK